jgi:hypothetical protein
MKLQVLCGALFCILGLSACQSVPEKDIPLPLDFSQQSQLYHVKRPKVLFSDDAYHESFGPFRIEHLAISKVNFEKETTDTSWSNSRHGSLLLDLLFRDSVNFNGEMVESYKSRKESSFHFEVNADGLSPVKAECHELELRQGEESQESNAWKTSKPDLKYLGCKIMQKDLVSEFVVEQKGRKGITFRLHHGNQPITFAPVFVYSQLAELQSLFLGGGNGFLLQQGADTLSAVQVSSNHSKIWLGTNVTAEQQQWLLAVMTSLQLYTWKEAP